jgi:thymidylate synthase (FAD)
MIEVVKPSLQIPQASYILMEEGADHLEWCGRTCYKSEDKITGDSADKFVRKICRNRHESVLEHVSFTVKFVLSRAASHQLVRHRLVSYSQESQRYVNYAKRGLQVICPPSIGLDPGQYELRDGVVTKGSAQTDEQRQFIKVMETAYSTYEELLDLGAKPEDARYVLPNAAKTEVVMSSNMRNWRHIFRERAINRHAQWEIRRLMTELYVTCKSFCPSVFGDLEND